MAVHSDHEGPTEGYGGAGAAVDDAQRIAARADGALILMLIKRRLSKSELEWAAGEFERAAKIIRSTLPSDT